MVPALAGCGTVGVEPGDSVLISRANGGGQDIQRLATEQRCETCQQISQDQRIRLALKLILP